MRLTRRGILALFGFGAVVVPALAEPPASPLPRWWDERHWKCHCDNAIWGSHCIVCPGKQDHKGCGDHQPPVQYPKETNTWIN